MRSVVASLAALSLAVPAAAVAQPVSTVGGSGPDTYLELHLGAFVPQSSDLDELDPGVAFGGTFGARFGPTFSVELELAYYGASSTAAAVRTALEAIPVTASLRARLPFKRWEVSAFAGGGVHFARWSADPDPGGYLSEWDTAFGYHFGAEAALYLSPTMRVGFEARRSFVNASLSGLDTDIGGLRLAATLGYHF
jgi:opacity protein-like surface antigen